MSSLHNEGNLRVTNLNLVLCRRHTAVQMPFPTNTVTTVEMYQKSFDVSPIQYVDQVQIRVLRSSALYVLAH